MNRLCTWTLLAALAAPVVGCAPVYEVDRGPRNVVIDRRPVVVAPDRQERREDARERREDRQERREDIRERREDLRDRRF